MLEIAVCDDETLVTSQIEKNVRRDYTKECYKN